MKTVKQFYLSNKKLLKIAHINVNSIGHKIEPFKEVLAECIFDVLAIQETKIDESFPDNQFDVPMYRLYRQDFRHNEGGIMMYIRHDFPQYRRSDIDNLSININTLLPRLPIHPSVDYFPGIHCLRPKALILFSKC